MKVVTAEQIIRRALRDRARPNRVLISVKPEFAGSPIKSNVVRKNASSFVEQTLARARKFR
jgi:aryl-alcohol dehydrogenase-like predicted oxidoreductase